MNMWVYFLPVCGINYFMTDSRHDFVFSMIFACIVFIIIRLNEIYEAIKDSNDNYVSLYDYTHKDDED